MLNKTEQSDRAPNPRVATRPRARAGRFLSDVPNLRRFDSESWLLESPELMAFGWQRLKRSPDSRSWNLFESAPLVKKKECVMDWNRIEGNWKQFKGRAKEKWGRLTDDDLDVINGRQEQLESKIQERYGLAKDQAKKDVEAWFNSLP